MATVSVSCLPCLARSHLAADELGYPAESVQPELAEHFLSLACWMYSRRLRPHSFPVARESFQEAKLQQTLCLQVRVYSSGAFITIPSRLCQPHSSCTKDTEDSIYNCSHSDDGPCKML